MLLRRLMEQIENQNWFAVVLDFVIVVVGVLLAFQISNWSERAGERRTGEDYAERLLEDLQIEQVAGHGMLEYVSVVEQHAHQAVELYHAPAGEADIEFVTAAYNATQAFGTLHFRSTYDELISTGQLRLLPSRDLAALANSHYLINYRWNAYEFLSTSRYRDRVRRLLPVALQQAVNEQCGDILDETGQVDGLAIDCVPDIPGELASFAAADLRGDPEFLPDLRSLISGLSYRLADMRNRQGFLDGGLEFLLEDTE